MGDIKGFLKVKRQKSQYRPVCERLKDFREVSTLREDGISQNQASRCMDCGTPFCHWACPVGNYIPEWNDLMFKGQWKQAIKLLQASNNLPEITGRLCSAVCEYACVLGINDDPVTIRENELAIIEHAFEKGYIAANPPKRRTGKKVAIIGSGPSGLSCADQLNQAGHQVTVFEKDDKPGGIMRYGIPDFKLEKWVLDRRVKIYQQEGVEFISGVNVGVNYPAGKLLKEFDAACLAGGSRVPRDLKIAGRDLAGIHFAMDYLIQSNQLVSGQVIPPEELINAKGKRVLVIGGGDTGADCVGTANRQGASCVVQIEVLAKPADMRTALHPWPKYPIVLKTSTSHEEGGQRKWSVTTKKFIGQNGKVIKAVCQEASGQEFEIDADLVVLAVGFIHPEHQGLLSELKVEFDAKGNVKTDASQMTSLKKVFSAGDIRRGQSLIVWAIWEGRKAAFYIDSFLMGRSRLPVI